MRVRIVMTVEVDPEVWAYEYGLDPSLKREIAEDVRNYFVNGVQECPVAQSDGIKVVR